MSTRYEMNKVMHAAKLKGAPPDLLINSTDHIYAWMALLEWEKSPDGQKQAAQRLNNYLSKFTQELRFIAWGLKQKDMSFTHKTLLKTVRKYLRAGGLARSLLEQLYALENWFVEQGKYRRLHQRSK